MAEQSEALEAEERRDFFTFLSGFLFVCLFVTAANAYFELQSRRLEGNLQLLMGVFRDVSLYVAPGLLCGIGWRKTGIPLGALAGAVVRLLSLIGLGFIMPYVHHPAGYRRFSLKAALEEVPNLPVTVLICLAAGAAAGAAGAILAGTAQADKRWFRALRSSALGLLLLGFVAAGGVTFVAFVPWGRVYETRDKLERLQRWMHPVNPALSIVIAAGLVLTALCFLAALPGLRRARSEAPEEAPEAPAEPQAEEGEEPTPPADSGGQ